LRETAPADQRNGLAGSIGARPTTRPFRSVALDLDARLAELEHDVSIPPGPDRNRIEAWSVDAHLRVWSDSH